MLEKFICELTRSKAKAIKAIIMDVDGVILGEQQGFNCPHPNEHVRSNEEN